MQAIESRPLRLVDSVPLARRQLPRPAPRKLLEVGPDCRADGTKPSVSFSNIGLGHEPVVLLSNQLVKLSQEASPSFLLKPRKPAPLTATLERHLEVSVAKPVRRGKLLFEPRVTEAPLEGLKRRPLGPLVSAAEGTLHPRPALLASISQQRAIQNRGPQDVVVRHQPPGMVMAEASVGEPFAPEAGVVDLLVEDRSNGVLDGLFGAPADGAAALAQGVEELVVLHVPLRRLLAAGGPLHLVSAWECAGANSSSSTSTSSS